MKKHLILLLFISFFLIPSLALSEENSKKSHNWFLGLGGHAGYEALELTNFGGGISLPAGYNLTPNLSVYGVFDAFFSRKRQVNYAFLSLMPAVAYRFYKGLSVYGSAGYVMMHPSQLNRLWDGRTNTNNFYHGLKAETGIGFNHKFAPNIIFSPQIGTQYTYMASDHLLTPVIRINLLLTL
jgi:hypothetical protein